MNATMMDPNFWSEANVVDIGHFLNLASPVSNGTDARITDKSRPERQLACARCHAQKSRCVRANADPRTCNRCLSAGLQCIERRPQRMGRPVEVGTKGSRSQHQSKALRSRSTSTNTSLPSPIRTEKRQGSIDTSPTNTCLPDFTFDFDTTPLTGHRVPGLDGWAKPLAPGESAFPYIRSSNPAVEGFPIVFDREAKDTNVNTMPGATNSIGTLSTSYKSQGSHLTDAGGEEFFSLGRREASDSEPRLDGVLEDPFEHLSNVHLRLYKCLTWAKSVEKQIKSQVQEFPATPSKPIDTSWSVHLFQTTEIFIKVLGTYADGIAPSGGHPSEKSNDSEMTRDGIEGYRSSQSVDTATGLMIVSSHVRFLQIFEVLVLALEKSLDMDFPGGLIQVRFGDFVPAGNKAFYSRIVGQYLLHLLDSMSEVVGRVVASRQPYSKAIADSKTVAAELKERILTILQ